MDSLNTTNIDSYDCNLNYGWYLFGMPNSHVAPFASWGKTDMTVAYISPASPNLLSNDLMPSHIVGSIIPPAARRRQVLRLQEKQRATMKDMIYLSMTILLLLGFLSFTTSYRGKLKEIANDRATRPKLRGRKQSWVALDAQPFVSSRMNRSKGIIALFADLAPFHTEPRC